MLRNVGKSYTLQKATDYCVIELQLEMTLQCKVKMC